MVKSSTTGSLCNGKTFVKSLTTEQFLQTMRMFWCNENGIAQIRRSNTCTEAQNLLNNAILIVPHSHDLTCDDNDRPEPNVPAIIGYYFSKQNLVWELIIQGTFEHNFRIIQDIHRHNSRISSSQYINSDMRDVGGNLRKGKDEFY